MEITQAGDKAVKSLRTIIGLIPILFLLSQNACSSDITYEGKVIDAETLEPIEGAVVVAIWRKTRSRLIDTTIDFKDAKEILTDKNGDWAITGPEGNYDKMIGLIHLLGVYVTQSPEFIIYKPGYVKYWTLGCFDAFPYVFKEYGVEGIVLRRPGDTREKLKQFNKKYRNGFIPFIPVKDPEKKLRGLDFSFEYPENVKKVGWPRDKGPFKVYTVVGLKKAKTREERLKASRFSVGEKALPISDKMQSDEREQLWGSIRRKAK